MCHAPRQAPLDAARFHINHRYEPRFWMQLSKQRPDSIYADDVAVTVRFHYEARAFNDLVW